jgi:hypothetical protein
MAYADGLSSAFKGVVLPTVILPVLESRAQSFFVKQRRQGCLASRPWA